MNPAIVVEHSVTTPESEDRSDLTLLGHSDLGGCGDAMQMMVHGTLLYVGHLGPHGTSVVDVSDPSAPQVVRRLQSPTHASAPKVQVAGGLLLTNAEQRGTTVPERTGLAIFSLDDPTAPTPLGFFETKGLGVHRMWYAGGPYVYASAELEGYLGRILVIIDVTDPEHPVEVGRWWWPGQWQAGGERLTWPSGLEVQLHHAIVVSNLGFAGLWDGGMVILDLSQPDSPSVISKVSWAPELGGTTHTALPLPSRNLLVVTDEALRDNCQEPPKHIRIFDIADVRQPILLSLCPTPEGDFCDRGLWFGPHNLHENAAHTYVSDELIFATYANAGLRVYDIVDPRRPREVAHYIPSPAPGKTVCQSNDVVVDEGGLVYVSDRIGGGVAVLRPTGRLKEKMRPERPSRAD